MGTADKNGIWKYDNADTVNGWPNFMNLGANSVSNAIAGLRPKVVYTATSLSDANSKVTALKNDGLLPSASAPFFFWRSDVKSLYTYDNSSWNEIGKTNVTVANVGNMLIQSGSWTYNGVIPVNQWTEYHNITFPVPYSNTPIVVTTASNSRLTTDAGLITTTGFSTSFSNWSNASPAYPTATVNWIAMGLKS